MSKVITSFQIEDAIKNLKEDDIMKSFVGVAYLTLNQKLTYFFYYYSFEIDGNKSVIQKILFGIERMTRTDSKITLVKIKFSMNTCKHLNKAEVDNFSDTARDFFCFIQSFENKLKVRDFVDL